MSQSQINSMYIKRETDRVHQGDILKDYNVVDSWEYIENNEETGEKQYKMTFFKLSYAVVMTQECDLEGDYRDREKIKNIENQQNETQSKGIEIKKLFPGAQELTKKHDKYIPMILICPAYPAEMLKEGTHLKEQWQQNMENWKKIKKYDDITKQNHPRFHYLKGDPEYQAENLIIDFKHYFTVPRNEFYRVYNETYLVSLNELFREYLSQRFAHYLSRIGLPDLSICNEVEQYTDSQ
jgi:hypothetical protein